MDERKTFLARAECPRCDLEGFKHPILGEKYPCADCEGTHWQLQPVCLEPGSYLDCANEYIEAIIWLDTSHFDTRGIHFNDGLAAIAHLKQRMQDALAKEAV